MHTSRFRERFLHHIWCNQYVRPERLRTTDGRPVVVVDPGRLSLDAGPDVRDARLQIGETFFAGDVEIHRTSPEWDTHGHHKDPRYNGVILHVVLDQPPSTHRTVTASGREIPVTALGEALAGDLNSIRKDAVLDEQESVEGFLLCSGFNDGIPSGVLDAWIDRLAVERFEIKLRRFDERLRELARPDRPSVRETVPEWGRAEEEASRDDIPPPQAEPTMKDLTRRDIWEQLLYEGLMEGLGYSRNRIPFLRLATTLTLGHLRPLSLDTLQTEAILLGHAGFLPSEDECTDVEARTYAHMLRTEWARLSGHFTGERLTKSDWVLVPTRPLNTPTLRLVAARDIIRKFLHADLFRSLVDTIRASQDPVQCRNRMHLLLTVEPGPFWERRVSFQRILPRRVRTLGAGRIDDLVVNCIIPVLLLYARTFRAPALREQTLHILATYPATQDNYITRRMARQLLHKRVVLDTSVRQQGVIQLFQYYCREGRCRDCDVGRLIWGT